jgi:hypothetical protein
MLINKIMAKLKTYIALSVFLSRCPKKHWLNNNRKQFTILCQTTSKKRVAELVDCSLHHLQHMGIHETNTPNHVSVCKKPHTIYYLMDHLNENKEDYLKWFEYT